MKKAPSKSVSRSTRAAILALGLIQGTLWGCASAGTPLERAAQITDQALSEGIRRSESPAASEGAVRFVGRYNPCRCEAPPFEILSYGRWTRVEIESDDPELLEALEVAARGAAPTAEFTLLGWPQTGPRYELLELEGFEPAERTSARGSSTSRP